MNLIKRVYYGYCQYCGLPQPIGILMLPGWKHQYPICGICLKQMSDDIFRLGNVIPDEIEGLKIPEDKDKQ